jgi:PAS domain S-box-containing protein
MVCDRGPRADGFVRLPRPLLLLVITAFVVARTAVAAPRAIKVVLDSAYAPYSFQSDGKVEGILVDQWRAWEKQTGIKVEIQALNWNEALRRMSAGEFDVIDSIVDTPARRQSFDFTPPYATIEASIFFRHDISGISDLASLKGFPVGVKEGDQHIDTLAAGGVTTAIFFPNNDQMIKAARQKKINVFVCDVPSALYLLNRNGIEAEFRQSPPIFRDELRRAVRKGDTALLRTVSAGFDAIPPAELARINERWFGSTINRYRRYVLYAGYAAAAALLLIAALAGWNRMLRKKVLQRTAALAESEERFRQIADHIDEVFWLVDVKKQTTLYLSPAYEAVWGRMRDGLLGEPRSIFAAVHPEDCLQVDGLLAGQHDQAFEVACRIVRPDASIRWIRFRGFPIRDRSGHVYRAGGVAEDITERKQAEDELQATTAQLRALSAKLESAREEEGIRIAREIHDELGSALAILNWNLKAMLSGPEEQQVPDLRERVAALLSLTDSTIQVVRRIASELRPSVFDMLGLAEAIQWQAQQFQDRTGIAVHGGSSTQTVALNRERSGAVFRIFQEALTNILRHAQATRVDVALEEDAGVLSLTIRDNGRGITEAEKAARVSLGLLGMRERAHLIGGELDIVGAAGEGTTITLRVPIATLPIRQAPA